MWWEKFVLYGLVVEGSKYDLIVLFVFEVLTLFMFLVSKPWSSSSFLCFVYRSSGVGSLLWL